MVQYQVEGQEQDQGKNVQELLKWVESLKQETRVAMHGKVTATGDELR